MLRKNESMQKNWTSCHPLLVGITCTLGLIISSFNCSNYTCSYLLYQVIIVDQLYLDVTSKFELT